MRRPWVPRVQSRAWEQVSNEERSVREQEREGSRDDGIGGNRVSPKALARDWLVMYFFFYIYCNKWVDRRREKRAKVEIIEHTM